MKNKRLAMSVHSEGIGMIQYAKTMNSVVKQNSAKAVAPCFVVNNLQAFKKKSASIGSKTQSRHWRWPTSMASGDGDNPGDGFQMSYLRPEVQGLHRTSVTVSVARVRRLFEERTTRKVT